MRRLELLIDIARELSQNTSYDANSGVSQKSFVQFYKNAQDSLLKQIVNVKTKFFIKEKLVDAVAGQQFYNYPSDIYLQNIDTLEWSQDGQYYIPLTKCITKERLNSRVGYAFGYIPRSDGVILTPPVTNGSLRFNYIKNPLVPEKRSGKISSITIVGDDITAITVDPAESSFDQSYLNLQNYICIVDKFGRQKVSNIEIDSVSNMGVFTLPSHALQDGEMAAIGDYVVAGLNATNLMDFPTICESYFIKHAVYEAKYGDSSQWTKQAVEDMDRAAITLLDSFKTLSDDITQVPITNTDYLDLW